MNQRPKSVKFPWNKPSTTTGIANRPYDPFYHTNQWKVTSRMFIDGNPLCAMCQKQGKLTPAKITDHIVPKDLCPDPWDRSNWQPLCHKCHAVKSAKDKKQFAK